MSNSAETGGLKRFSTYSLLLMEENLKYCIGLIENDFKGLLQLIEEDHVIFHYRKITLKVSICIMPRWKKTLNVVFCSRKTTLKGFYQISSYVDKRGPQMSFICLRKTT